MLLLFETKECRIIVSAPFTLHSAISHMPDFKHDTLVTFGSYPGLQVTLAVALYSTFDTLTSIYSPFDKVVRLPQALNTAYIYATIIRRTHITNRQLVTYKQW